VISYTLHQAKQLGVFVRSLLFSAKIPSFGNFVDSICFASTPMPSPQLSNYLRANRKRLALAQDEVAFLLGTQSGAKICRHERFVSEPDLETALAYEAIFKRSVSELFGGLYQKVEREVAERAKGLINKKDRKANAQTARKLQALTELAMK
jgi:transcriptional regulator with XRE-family HTH domain